MDGQGCCDGQGWEYERHEQFSVVLNNANRLTGDDRLRGIRSIANELHKTFSPADNS